MTVPLRSSEKHFSKVHDFMKRFLTTRFFIKVKFERTTRLKLQKKKKKIKKIRAIQNILRMKSSKTNIQNDNDLYFF